MTTKADAAKEILARRKARRDLHSFIRYINPDYIVSDFSRTVCAEIDSFIIRMMAGERPVLILGAPPQHGKSDIVSRYLPAFFFGKFPDQRLAGLSYGKDLASDMNRDVQRIMMGDEYRNIFPGSCLNSKRVVTMDVEAKRNSETFEIVGHKGSYVSQGVGGPLTGKKVDCVAWNSLINTDIGLIHINKLKSIDFPVKVLSQNINTGEISYESVSNFKEVERNGFYRITDKSGRILECTGDHRVFTENRGYIRADKLSTSDRVVFLLPERVYKTSVRYGQMDKQKLQKPLLFEKLQGRACQSRQSGSKVLQGLREENKETIWRFVRGLLGKSKVSTNRKGQLQSKQNMCFLWEAFQGITEKPFILLKKMLGSRTRFEYGWGRKLKLAWWQYCVEGVSGVPTGIFARQKGNTEDERKNLPDLREFTKYPIPPQGWESFKQQHLEHRDPLQGLSCISSQITAIEFIKRKETFCDITVGNNHNFFANGFLVHNCGIIDDPIKNSKEALSQTTKKSVWNWYVSTFLTRLSKNSGHIIMATRWAEDDLSGRVIEKNDKATVLSFKAISDNGEALIPDLHPIYKLLETKAILGEYFWSAMYQQSPTALGGDMFKSGHWKYYTYLPPLRSKAIYGDTALKAEEEHDYTVLQCWGESYEGRLYLIDQVREKLEAPALEAFTKAFYNKHKTLDGCACTAVKIEDKASGIGLIQSIKGSGIPIVGIPRAIDKIVRAHCTTPLIESGSVYLPEDAPWLSDYLVEFNAFPNGVNDDQVDPTMDAVADFLGRASIDYGAIL